MRIREARGEDAGHLARVGVDTWRTAYRGIVPDARLATLSYEEGETKWRNRLSEPDTQFLALVVENEVGDIVGYATAGPPEDDHPPYKGELRSIYVLQEYQGKGIGRALMQSACRWLHRMNLQPMILWVFTDNHSSRAFYERLGGRLTAMTRIHNIGGKDIEATAYGWDDLSALIA